MGHDFRPGTSPILVSIPHNGSSIPESIRQTMTQDGQSSRDTDWFLDRLYAIEELSDASFLVATLSRYVIDLNRPEDDHSLYPGQRTTGLIPHTCFDGSPIYANQPPSAEQTQRRIQSIWRPYHDQLQNELNRLTQIHGHAILVEAHSIASEVPQLFPGRLPDFNLGTNHSQSCAASLEKVVTGVLNAQSEFSHVTNGRFVGGFNTRQFGRPEQHQHAFQIEMAQSMYMDESTQSWDDQRASRAQSLLSLIMTAVLQWTPNR